MITYPRLPLTQFARGDGDDAMFRRAVEAGMANRNGIQRVIDVPPGWYDLKKPLVCVSKHPNQKPPALVCQDGMAVIYYQGPITNDYVLRFGGDGVRFRNLATLEGITVVAKGRARGIRLDGCAYGSACDRVETVSTRQVAIEAKDCFMARFGSFSVRQAAGCAFYNNESNSLKIEGLKVDTTDADWAPELLKAAVLFAEDTHASSTNLLCLEGVNSGSHPVILLQGVGHRLRDIRFEGVECKNELIELAPWTRLIDIGMVTLSKVDTSHVVYIGRECKAVNVSHVFGGVINKAVVHIDGSDTRKLNFGPFEVTDRNQKNIPDATWE